MPKSFRVLLLLTLPLLFVAPAQAEPVAVLEGEAGLVTLETRVTQRVVRQDDSGAEEIVYLEDTWLAPGAILRYELIVHNQAENEAVAADSLVITSPFPKGCGSLRGSGRQDRWSSPCLAMAAGPFWRRPSWPPKP